MEKSNSNKKAKELLPLLLFNNSLLLNNTFSISLFSLSLSVI